MAYTERGPRVDINANAVRIFRTTHGWTQFDLAVAAGVQPSTVCRIETGAQSPTLVTAEKLARALQVKLEALIGRTPHLRPSRAWSCHRRAR
jgi:transcriptional regulator with XRE-family HTH domain